MNNLIDKHLINLNQIKYLTEQINIIESEIERLHHEANIEVLNNKRKLLFEESYRKYKKYKKI